MGEDTNFAPKDERKEHSVAVQSGQVIPPPHQPKTDTVRAALRFAGLAFLFNALLWLFGLFVQIRGWANDVRTSYVILSVMWIIGTLICLAVANQSNLQRKLLATLIASTLWAAALVGLNAIAPKPTQSGSQTTQPAQKPTPTQSTPTAEEIAKELAKDLPRQHDLEKQLAPEQLITKDKVETTTQPTAQRPYDITGSRHDAFVALLNTQAEQRDVIRVGCVAWSDPACVAAGKFLILFSEAGWKIDSDRVFRMEPSIPSDGIGMVTHIEPAIAADKLPPHLGHWNQMDTSQITFWRAFRWMQIPISPSGSVDTPVGTIGIFFGPEPESVPLSNAQKRRELLVLLQQVFIIDLRQTEKSCPATDLCTPKQLQLTQTVSAYLEHCECDLNKSWIGKWKEASRDSASKDQAQTLERQRKTLEGFLTALN